MLRFALAALALAAVLLVPASASADPVATIEVRGLLSGGASFSPASVTAAVGDDVAWVGRDLLGAHEIAERHGLWRLDQPLGPGATGERTFEAGTHEVVSVGRPQTGTVAVPVQTRTERRRVRRSTTRGRRARSRTVTDVHVRWSADPAEDHRFDAQRRRPDGRWIAIAEEAPEATGRFRTTPGVTWEVRARLRSSERPGTTSWSPVVTVTG